MATVLTSSQQTFVDITDQRKLSAYITSNLPKTQSEDPNVLPHTYAPSWATTNLKLTPVIFLDQTNLALDASGLTITWKRKDTVTGISADGQWYRLKSGGYIITNKKYVSYRKELESNVGFKPYKVRVAIADLNIRKGPGTNYAKTGKYTGKGTFTIVEEKIGQGSTKGWGKLKSKAGWIALDYTIRC